MKRKRNGWMMLLLASWLIVWTEIAVAQASGTLELRIRLRYSDGTAVVGEAVMLERLPDEEPIAPECVTDANGEGMTHQRYKLEPGFPHCSAPAQKL